MRIKRLSDIEGEQLMYRLRIIEEEEAERQKKRKLQEIEDKAEEERLYRIRITEYKTELIRAGSGYLIDDINK